MFSIIIRILFLAFTIAFLGAWGIIKEQKRDSELLALIYKKVERKIIKLLKRNGNMSFSQLKYEIDGIKASLFWSRKKIQVMDSSKVTKIALNNLIEKEIVDSIKDKNKEIYKLRSVK